MSFQSIRQEIKDVIDAESDLIQVTYLTNRSTFEGFPACVVTPSESQADYGSTHRDKVTYTYDVRVYYPIKDEDAQEEVDLRLEKVVDELLDIFKSRNVLGSVCDWVEPAPSAWGQSTASETPYRMASITLKCVKHIDNTTLVNNS